MNINRRRLLSFSKKELIFHQQRFYPSGTYYWTVPEGCTQVDVFLVGGGGGAENGGAGGGYTKTYKSSSDGYKDGNAIPVTPGETIEIIVGKGGEGIYNEDTNYGPSLTGNPGGYSQFKNSLYRAEGGRTGSGGYLTGNYGGDGGSGGGSYYHGGSDGEDGGTTPITDGIYQGGTGQHHTTRDFGESSGKRNSGGGSGGSSAGQRLAGESDYIEGSGEDGTLVGSGYSGLGGGGAARGNNYSSGSGGDGRVIIRYYAY